ncbi:rRNA maturation RNase YbeY [Ktedonosporobacter rubrisoli]|uniref:Endoribonuclease YbeY n=1 Tax=Ktedonosporobacter rubrisoli TaxID=2509675 RepID=A0A4V0YZ30_KTERU|nr:rRNA maturation RNase YbeY [Ktedonosporobacter rubrisoli]QBD78291.1 rRNA maturation RNase YbeY [Ktedonosporobacter rubrisoli]
MEHPLIELYVSITDSQDHASAEQLLQTVDIDDVVVRTLHAAGIQQQVMLTVLITDDEGIREMNMQYRNQDKPTDVLSFPLLNKPLVEAPQDQLWVPQEDAEEQQAQHPDFITPPGMVQNLGDIVISWHTLLQQAQNAGHGPLYELIFLLAHGVLHLVGYDDQTEAGYRAMVGIQEQILRQSGQKV